MVVMRGGSEGIRSQYVTMRRRFAILRSSKVDSRVYFDHVAEAQLAATTHGEGESEPPY
jgi:hypothetical protein